MKAARRNTAPVFLPVPEHPLCRSTGLPVDPTHR